jgi:hypothetical protein
LSLNIASTDSALLLFAMCIALLFQRIVRASK